MESGDVRSRIDQALALLEGAIEALDDASSTDGFPTARVRELVTHACNAFQICTDPSDPGFTVSVLTCNGLLDDALKLASKHAELTPEHVSAVSAIERGQSILYFVAFRGPDGTPEGKPLSLRPQPVVWTTRPPAPPTESDVDLASCDLDALEAMLGGKSLAVESDEPEIELGSLPPDELDTGDEASKPEPAPAPQRNSAPPLELVIKVTFDGPTNFYLGFDEDIGCGGLFISTYDKPPLGSEVVLFIALPGGQIARVRGVVRWARDVVDPDEDSTPGVGVRFVELGAHERKAITAFTRTRAPLFYEDE